MTINAFVYRLTHAGMFLVLQLLKKNRVLIPCPTTPPPHHCYCSGLCQWSRKCCQTRRAALLILGTRDALVLVGTRCAKAEPSCKWQIFKQWQQDGGDTVVIRQWPSQVSDGCWRRFLAPDSESQGDNGNVEGGIQRCMVITAGGAVECVVTCVSWGCQDHLWITVFDGLVLAKQWYLSSQCCTMGLLQGKALWPPSLNAFTSVWPG